VSPAETDAGKPAVPRPAYDWAAANHKKKEAIAQLASLSTTMDDIDARIKNSSNAPETSISTDPGPRRLSGARRLAGEDGWWVAQRGHVTVLCARLPPALLAGGHDHQLVRQAASALGVL